MRQLEGRRVQVQCDRFGTDGALRRGVEKAFCQLAIVRVVKVAFCVFERSQGFV